MQSFVYAPSNFGAKENQKNYVFVDEHNRHKRLKVMRACEGCRRRKIRCDAATSNTWPCSACIRLKLRCIPPTVNYDQDFSGSNSSFGGDRVADFSSGIAHDEYSAQYGGVQQPFDVQSKPMLPMYQQHGHTFADDLSYQGIPFTQAQQPIHYNHDMTGSSMNSQQYLPQNIYQSPAPPLSQHSLALQQQQHQQQMLQRQQTRALSVTQSEMSDGLQQEQFDQDRLATLLGDLKMDAGGRAPYLSSKRKNKTAEEPAVEEDTNQEVDAYNLPPSTPGTKIRIPHELFPDDETCEHYFELYFLHVHPYVPVLNKTLFYRQWRNDRESISPLILEAIFAIAGKLSDEPSQGQQWLALAGKHVDSFMDVPRLSTLQALLIILKARESAPKKGYYYRSWMTVVQCVNMAKDLGLDEHFEDHNAGRPCGTDPTDCITRTRIWQTIFVCECMIGSPQDRTDMAVGLDTLDLTLLELVPGEPVIEWHTTRNFNYFTRVVKNVRRMNDIYGRIKKKEKWGLDPELTNLNPEFDTWLTELPDDLQITFPDDTVPPWLSSHQIGNMHSYYYLSIIMLHRPQLSFLDPSQPGGQWKYHMATCYDSAKKLCRIQEAIINLFEMRGLLCMQRGVNFTIYAILTCVVLHLVALTSPDPDISTDARDFFARHMRILEKCTSAWPMPDMQQQIDALREAFSADLDQPFQLKLSFPYNTPSPRSHAQSNSPPMTQYQPPSQVMRSPIGVSSLEQQIYVNHPLTPPISAGIANTTESPAVNSLIMMTNGSMNSQAMSSPITGTGTGTNAIGTGPVWNPRPIFQQWQNTFEPMRPLPTSQPSYAKLEQGGQLDSGLALGSHSQGMASSQYTMPQPTFATSTMWQESVANVFETGQKRGWDYDGSGSGSHAFKRHR